MTKDNSDIYSLRGKTKLEFMTQEEIDQAFDEAKQKLKNYFNKTEGGK